LFGKGEKEMNEALEEAKSRVRENIDRVFIYRKLRNTREIHRLDPMLYNQITFQALRLKDVILKNICKN
jgi:hypothetical protein